MKKIVKRLKSTTMYRAFFKVISKTEPDWVNYPDAPDPDGLWRSLLTLCSRENDEGERDEIVTILWDHDAFLDLSRGENVLVTLQFGIHYKEDGSKEQIANVVEIKHLEELENTRW